MPEQTTKEILNLMAEARGEMEKIDVARLAQRKVIAELNTAYSTAATREAKAKAVMAQKKAEENQAASVKKATASKAASESGSKKKSTSKDK